MFRKSFFRFLVDRNCKQRFLVRHNGLHRSSNSSVAPATILLHNLKPLNDIQNQKIDPIVHPKVYKTPNVHTNIEDLIFGFPVATQIEIHEPTKTVNMPLVDPDLDNKTKIEAHKRDKIWRRIGMKRHRYMRWKKRNETMLRHIEIAQQKKQAVREKEEIESIWKDAGLDREPPILSDEQKRDLSLQWKAEGIWSEAFTPQELYEMVTPPEPKNKVSLPPDHSFVPK